MVAIMCWLGSDDVAVAVAICRLVAAISQETTGPSKKKRVKEDAKKKRRSGDDLDGQRLTDTPACLFVCLAACLSG
jgi:hypothetical protein